MSDAEIQNLANSLAPALSPESVCPGIQYILDYSRNRYCLQSFDRWVSASISKFSFTTDDAVRHIQAIFDAKVNQLVSLSNMNPLGMENSGIDDRLMEVFAKMLDGLSDFNDRVAPMVTEFVRSMVKGKGEATFDGVRAFLLLFYLPILYDNKYENSVLRPVLMYFRQAPQGATSIITRWLLKLPFLVKRIVKASHLMLTNVFTAKGNVSLYARKVDYVLDVLRMIWEMNQSLDDPLHPSVFYNKALNECINPVEDFENYTKGHLSFLDYHFVLNLKTKRREACCQANLMRRHAFILSSFDGDHYEKYMEIHVRRESLLDDTMRQLKCMHRQDFVKKLRVMFSKEVAVDAGGPSREFFYLLTAQLFNPEYGMFKSFNNRCFWFTHSEKVDEDKYFLIGSVLGLAVYNSVVLPIKLPLALYKKLCNPVIPMSTSDLAEIEPTLAASLTSIKRSVERGEDVSSMYLTFDATIEVDGKPKTVPIIEGMEGVAVTNENVGWYVRSYVNFLLNRSVEKQFKAFREGFDLACPATAYKLMAPQELDILVSGEESFDWDALIKNAKYKNGYSEKSRPIRWFWEIFKEMTLADKRNLLKFSTGADKAPLGGLGNMRLIIERIPNSNHLPMAHTCFATFTLPEYSSKEVMKAKVMKAIQYTEGFGLV